ncbi:MAG: YgaP family membrane protein [Bacteroidales bacterium]
MKKNMGNIDKGIRILIAIVIVVLYFTNIITGTLAIVLLALSAIFVLTSIIGFCPLYLPLGIKTDKENK